MDGDIDIEESKRIPQIKGGKAINFSDKHLVKLDLLNGENSILAGLNLVNLKGNNQEFYPDSR